MTYRPPWQVRYWHSPRAWLTSQRHKLTVFAHARDTRPYTPGPGATRRHAAPAGQPGPGAILRQAQANAIHQPGRLPRTTPPRLRDGDYVVSGPRQVPHSLADLAIITGRRLALEIAA